ncbi:MAG: hypothetical protein HKL82_00040 [Acidimicrobiaceae bacterium]|nr:hypothetical protein [Acidimicrobiaceae bacterium]
MSILTARSFGSTGSRIRDKKFAFLEPFMPKDPEIGTPRPSDVTGTSARAQAKTDGDRFVDKFIPAEVRCNPQAVRSSVQLLAVDLFTLPTCHLDRGRFRFLFATAI